MNFSLNDSTVNKDKPKAKKNSKQTNSKTMKQVTIAADEEEEAVYVRRPGKVVIVEDDPQPEPSNRSYKESINNIGDSADNSKLAPPNLVPELSPRQKLLLVPRAHMTKGEQKRLQWEIEKAAIDKLKKENEERAQKLGFPLTDSKPDNNSSIRRRNSNSGDKPLTVKSQSSVEDQVVVSRHVEPDFVPGLGNLHHPENSILPELMAPNKHSSTAAPPSMNGNRSYVEQPPVKPANMQPILQPPSLSKAELKRMQWNKELGKF